MAGSVNSIPLLSRTRHPTTQKRGFGSIDDEVIADIEQGLPISHIV